MSKSSALMVTVAPMVVAPMVLVVVRRMTRDVRAAGFPFGFRFFGFFFSLDSEREEND